MLRKNFKLLSIILSVCLLATAIFPLGTLAEQVNSINVDPIAYYTFDGANLGADEAGSYPLTDNGISTVVDGTSGKGVSFDSNHLYSTFLYNMNLLEGATDFTVSADAKFADAPDANQCIFSNGWQGQGGFSFGYSSHEWMFICADAVGGDWIAFNIKGALGDDSFNAYAWHNFTLTVKNGVDLAVYIDGKLAHSVTLGSTLNTVNADFPFAIGTTHSGGYPFNGAVDEVKAFNVGLTAEQVAALVADKETDKPDVDEPGTDEPTGDAPEAYYTFDGADLGADEAGSYPLTNSNLATVVDGKIGDAAHFDNQHLFNLFLYNSADPLEGKSDFTVSAFAKLDAGVTADEHCIFSNGGWGNGGITFMLNTHEWLHINVDTAAGTQDLGFHIASATGNASFNAYEWHNYAVTVKGGTTLNVYIDGALAYTATLNGAINTTNTASVFAVGTTFNGGYPFCGAIDIVKVFDKELTTEQIAALANVGDTDEPDTDEPGTDEPATKELIADYTFDGVDLGADATGKYPLTDATLAAIVDGKNGNGVSFDSDHLYSLFLYNNSLLKGTNTFSVSVDAKFDDAPDANQCIFSTGWQGQGGLSFGYSSSEWIFITADATGGDWIAFNIKSALSDYEFDPYAWHNFTLTINEGTQLSVYIDGKLAHSTTLGSALNPAAVTSPFAVGTTFNGGYPFNGSLDNLKVFNYALTASEVENLNVTVGDVNGDGELDVRDLVRLKKIVGGTATASEQACDVNKDGEINALDLGALRKEILQKKNEIIDNKLTVSSAFTDNMVLQRNENVRIYGTGGEVGSEVTVNFADQTKTGTVGEDGWEVYLDPMPANTIGSDLTVACDGETTSFTDVVVGEVFICCGQSNMDYTYSYFYNKDNSIATEYNTFDNFNNIRCKRVSRVSAPRPITYTNQKDRWQTFTDLNSASGISAYALAFALNLSEILGEDVPVGIVDVAYGGSSIQQWMDKEALEGYGWVNETCSVFYNGMLHDVIKYTSKGFLWHQGCSNAGVGGETIYKELFTKFLNMIRTKIGDADYPVITTQLSQYDVPWTAFRQAQFELTKELNNVYMVSSIDTGCNVVTQAAADAVDAIHPTQKWAIGQRAAGIAASEIYGIEYSEIPEGVVYGDTPYISGASYSDGNIVLTVENATALSTKEVSLGFNSALENKNGEIGYFEIYNGTDWVEVEATISGATITLTTDITTATAIRYLQNSIFADGNAFVYNEYGNILAPIASVTIK